jgi:DNA polymerase-3 subunit alpha
MAEEVLNIDFPKFVHLRVHSSYSLSEGAIRPEEIGKIAAKHSMPAVAVTDSGNLFGLLETSTYCTKYGVQAIPAIEANFAINKPDSENANNFNHNIEYPKILLLAQNEVGYKNLLKLVSDSFLSGIDHTKPIIYLDDLKNSSEGLICLSGGWNGILDSAIRDNQIANSQKLAEEFSKIFPNNFYIELNRFNQNKQAEVEVELLKIAKKLNIPLVATNNVFFEASDYHEAQDILMCIAAGALVGDENRKKYSNQQYFKSQDEMAELFANLPEALENSVKIAMRCSYIAKESKPMLPKFPTLQGRTDEEELWDVAFTGLCKRLGISEDKNRLSEKEQKYFDRLEFEKEVICNMGFAGYFLIVSDFIRWAKSQNIPVGPGRGSGAGSVIAWAMEITNLDPIRFGLLFERFLNPERVSMPDFDIDFCQERRGEVIDYVQKKYGADNVAQIITFGKLQARAVLRDVGRVLGIPYSKVDRISKMIPFNPVDPVTLEKAIAMDPELQREQKSDETIAHLLDISLKLEGMHRHASTHAAGVVIGFRKLSEIVPLYSDHRSTMPTTQYSMKYCEAAGLVKFDFLGLKTLTLIQKTIEMVEANEGVKIDIENIPFDDALTFKMLAEGKGTGVFQMESAGMRDSMRKMKIDSIEDIIALISLYRPGPMENIPNYIATKQGKKKPDYMHPSLKPVLEETYGVIIYQEQVMEIAKVMGGYTLGGADLLRRAMGKKIKAEMDAQREKFVAGAIKNNVEKAKAEEIFDLVAKFAGYGFNKSHAAAYAVIGYQTAYLKAHYPAEFLCACMNMELMDTDKILMFREEARRMGIDILPPHINKSGALFKVEFCELEVGSWKLEVDNHQTSNIKLPTKKTIRYALGALKNVGDAAMKELVEERNKNGAYKDLDDFVSRVPVSVMNKRQVESLAGCGAFDEIHKNRKQLFEEATFISRYNQTMHEEKNSSQESLFGGADFAATQKIKLKPCNEWNTSEKILKEFEAIGFYLDNHPVEAYLKIIPENRFIPIAELEDRIPISVKETVAREGGWGSREVYTNTLRTYLIGVPNRVIHRVTQGRRFSYFSLSDPTGMIEVNIFEEDLINEARDLLESNQPLVVLVEARKDEGGIRLLAQEISAVDDYIKTLKPSAEIFVKEENYSENTLKEIKSLFANDNVSSSEAKLKIPVNINITTADSFLIKLKLPENYFIDEDDVISKKFNSFEMKVIFA